MIYRLTLCISDSGCLCRWFIPVNVVLASTFGCLLGYLVAFMIKPPPEFFNFTVVMIGIGTHPFNLTRLLSIESRVLKISSCLSSYEIVMFLFAFRGITV